MWDSITGSLCHWFPLRQLPKRDALESQETQRCGESCPCFYVWWWPNTARLRSPEILIGIAHFVKLGFTTSEKQHWIFPGITCVIASILCFPLLTDAADLGKDKNPPLPGLWVLKLCPPYLLFAVHTFLNLPSLLHGFPSLHKHGNLVSLSEQILALQSISTRLEGQTRDRRALTEKAGLCLNNTNNTKDREIFLSFFIPFWILKN